MFMPLTRIMHIVFIATIIAFSILYLYLFRQESVDNPALGRITYKYKWGMGREMLVDANRDGITDARAIIYGSFGVFWSSDPVLEYWESTECDGYFDVHMIPDPPGHSKLLEHDEDHDGDYDIILYDSDVDAFLQSLSRPGCAGNGGEARNKKQ